MFVYDIVSDMTMAWCNNKACLCTFCNNICVDIRYTTTTTTTTMYYFTFTITSSIHSKAEC